MHYWADLQSVHGLRCYGKITRTLVTSLRPSHDMTTLCERSGGGVRALLAGDWWVTGGIIKIARQIWKVGVAGLPVTLTGGILNITAVAGLRASTGGILVT